LAPEATESASPELVWKYFVPPLYRLVSASPTLLAVLVEPSALVVVYVGAEMAPVFAS